MQGPAPQADCKTASDDRSTNAVDRHVKARPVRSYAARPSGVWGLALPFDMTFKPWFVHKAFQRHSVCHLRAFDLVSLRLDVCIWLVCTAIQPLSIALLLSALCTVLAVAVLAAHSLAPETYTRHCTAITTARRLLTLPFIKHHCSRQLQQRGPVAAVLQHFLVSTAR